MELLETLNTETKDAPKSRIGTAENASQFVIRLSQADQTRAILRTRIKGNIDGNAPYKKSDLEARGLGSNTNLNFRQGTAIINQFKTPYYDLVVEVPLLCDIRTAFGTSTERGDWSQVISEEYHRMVTEWEDWDDFIQFSQFQMLTFGIGPTYFPDETDWRPQAAKTQDVLLNDGAPSQVSQITAMVLRKDYTPPEIYAKIRNKDAASQLGWSVEAVEAAIIDARMSAQQPALDTEQDAWYQQKFKNADLFYGTYDAEAIQTGHVFVKEFDERVSHHIVRCDKVVDKFLYSKIGRFESMNDVLIPFRYDIGDGTWHSINGIGKEIYAYCQVFDRLRCREIDGAMIAASVMLQSKDGNAVTKAELLTIKNLNILPPGLQVQATNIGQGIDATVQVRRDMEQTLGSNIGSVYKAPNSTNPRKGQKQAIMEMQQTAQLGKGNINRWYTTYDKLHYKMYHRAVSSSLTRHMPGGKEAAEFRKRCIDRGVPEEALQQCDSIKAYRSAGLGSAANRIMITDWLMEHAGSFPEDGKTEALRIALSAMTNSQITSAIMGDRTPEKNDDEWEAVMENNALRTGGEVLITKLQSNVKHLEVHLGDAEQHIQQVEQGAQQSGGMDLGSLHELLIHLDGAGKHCFEHLQAINSDPIRDGDYKELQKRWQKMARVQDKVKQQLEGMIQAQQSQQQQAAPNKELLNLINYDKSPESVKAQLEQLAGVPRQQGDESISNQNIALKSEAAQLKADKQAQNKVLDDVGMSLQVKKTAKELAEPIQPAAPTK